MAREVKMPYDFVTGEPINLEKLKAFADLVRADERDLVSAAQPAPVQEPIGYLFQHDETGLTTVVDVQQVEWGFEKNNPRHQKIGPVYTIPAAAQRQWVGLTDEEVQTTWDSVMDGAVFTRRKVYEAIEAKVFEKNGAIAVPDALTASDGESVEYMVGWNDCRQLMLEMARKP
jgi:hypothetical protein